MGIEFCLEQVARIDKLEQAVFNRNEGDTILTKRITSLEQAVAELQEAQSKGSWLETNHPIRPPAEPKVCKTCGGSGKKKTGIIGNGININCGDVPCPDPCHEWNKPPAPKKYYCLCGAELAVLSDYVMWWYTCPELKYSGKTGSHYVLDGHFTTEAALLAELDGLPKGEQK
jgi:hypothetical protein